MSLTNNVLTVDLSSYSTKAINDTLYQKSLSVSAPFTLNAITNALTIDLTAYQKSLAVSAPFTLNGTTNALTIDLTAYQKSLAVSAPFTLNGTTNALTIDLTAYQKALAVTKTTDSPLKLDSLTNALTIDLTAYPKTTSLSTYYNPANFVVGAGLLLALKATGVNTGKYELDLDSASSPTFNSLTCAGLTLNSVSTSITANSTGVSIYGPNITLTATSSQSHIQFLNSSGSALLDLTHTNLVMNTNMTSYGTVSFYNGLSVEGDTSCLLYTSDAADE